MFNKHGEKQLKLNREAFDAVVRNLISICYDVAQPAAFHSVQEFIDAVEEEARRRNETKRRSAINK